MEIKYPNYPTASLQGLVIAEAQELGLATPPDVLKFIIAMAVTEVEDEIEKLWAIGKRPEGTYDERFKKAARSELKAHANVLTQIATKFREERGN